MSFYPYRLSLSPSFSLSFPPSCLQSIPSMAIFFLFSFLFCFIL